MHLLAMLLGGCIRPPRALYHHLYIRPHLFNRYWSTTSGVQINVPHERIWPLATTESPVYSWIYRSGVIRKYDHLHSVLVISEFQKFWMEEYSFLLMILVFFKKPNLSQYSWMRNLVMLHTNGKETSK